MKKICLCTLLLSLLIFSGQTVRAEPVRILNGQLFIGGTSYGTNDYQTYLAFNLTGRQRIPVKNYIFFSEQFFSVYQNHPLHPLGDYEFTVQMPYRPGALSINNEVFQPVWYSDSQFTIRASVIAPEATDQSPQFINVQGPFRMNGYFSTYGALNFTAKFSGSGTADLKFEKIQSRYFFLEASYNFGQPSKNDP